MRLQDASPEELLYLQLWELWQDHIMENGNQRRKRETELLQAHYREAGVLEPAEKSPLCFMFSSFIGGIQTALSMMEATQEDRERAIPT